MRIIFCLLLFSFLHADMGKIVNLELYDNTNPAVLTDILGDMDHVIVNVSYQYAENQVASDEYDYDLEAKTFQRFDYFIFYFKAFQRVYGAFTSPTEPSYTPLSELELGFAIALNDDYDLGFSYSYLLEDQNITTKDFRFGLRSVQNLNYAAAVGMMLKKTNVHVENYQPYLSLGFSTNEDSYFVFDLEASYAVESTATSVLLLDYTVPQSIEIVLQLQQTDEDLSRLGVSYRYKDEAACASSVQKTIQTLRVYTGTKVEREPNSYVMFNLSYSQEAYASVLDNIYSFGVSLRGFYN